MSMPMLEQQWTVADLQDLPDDGNRYEVIDGELLVTPAPSLDHQRAILGLSDLLRACLNPRRLGEVIISPADVVFSARRGVQPDLFVIPLLVPRPKRVEPGMPLLLAVEVLSPSTGRADRVKKRRLYRE